EHGIKMDNRSSRHKKRSLKCHQGPCCTNDANVWTNRTGLFNKLCHEYLIDKITANPKLFSSGSLFFKTDVAKQIKGTFIGGENTRLHFFEPLFLCPFSRIR